MPCSLKISNLKVLKNKNYNILFMAKVKVY